MSPNNIIQSISMDALFDETVHSFINGLQNSDISKKQQWELNKLTGTFCRYCSILCQGKTYDNVTLDQLEKSLMMYPYTKETMQKYIEEAQFAYHTRNYHDLMLYSDMVYIIAANKIFAF